VAGCALLATGCATAVAYAPPWSARRRPVLFLRRIATLSWASLIGRGQPCALFGASGLEALAQVRAPRRFGAGSGHAPFQRLRRQRAASYYAMKSLQGDGRFGSNGSLSEDYKTFFAGYKDDVSQDFESALLWRQIGSFRWILNPALAPSH